MNIPLPPWLSIQRANTLANAWNLNNPLALIPPIGRQNALGGVVAQNPPWMQQHQQRLRREQWMLSDDYQNYINEHNRLLNRWRTAARGLGRSRLILDDFYSQDIRFRPGHSGYLETKLDFEDTAAKLSKFKGKSHKRRKSPKRRSPKRRSPKRKSPKRRSPKRRSPKRRSPRRRSPKRKSPKRKSPKRKSPKRKSPKRKSHFGIKSSKFPSDAQIMQFIQDLNINYDDKDYVLKIWKKLFKLAEEAGKGTSRQDKTNLQVFKNSVDDQIKFLDELTTDGSGLRFDALKETYPQDITGNDIYSYIMGEKELDIELTSVVGADNKGRPCIDKCRLHGGKCMCRLIDGTQELSECHPQNCPHWLTQLFINRS